MLLAAPRLSAALSLSFFSGAPGGGEILLLFIVILVLFGPRRLPEMARAIGRILDQVRRASHEFSDQIMQIDRPAFHDVPPEVDEPSAAKETSAATSRDDEEERPDPPGT